MKKRVRNALFSNICNSLKDRQQVIMTVIIVVGEG